MNVNGKNVGEAATHGWDPNTDEMHSMLFAFGPNFKENSRIENLCIVDVYPVMAKLLNVTSSKEIDGNIEKWKDVFVN